MRVQSTVAWEYTRNARKKREDDLAQEEKQSAMIEVCVYVFVCVWTGV